MPPLLSATSSGRGRVDDRTVPVFDQLAVSHAEDIEGKHFVPRPRSRRRILAVILMDNRDEVAFGHDDFQGIPGRRLRTGRLSTTCRAAGCSALRGAAESRLE